MSDRLPDCPHCHYYTKPNPDYWCYMFVDKPASEFCAKFKREPTQASEGGKQ